MIKSIGVLLLAGLFGGKLARLLRLPEIVGMLLMGVLIGSGGLGALDEGLLSISDSIRSAAFIIILLKAGIMLQFRDLKKIGRPALLLCFLPASFELAAWVLFAPGLLHLSRLEAGIIGAVMGAVSPAVVVPRMTVLMEKGWGTAKGIPQMIIAGSSADDVYVIVIFTALLSLAGGESVRWWDFAGIPLSMLTGIATGVIAGALLTYLFTHLTMRATKKCILLLSIAFILVGIEDAVKALILYAGYLAVISMGMYVLAHAPACAQNLAGKLSKLWVGAELFLFVLVGAEAQPQYLLEAGLSTLAALLLGLLFRSMGTWLCLLGTRLTFRERLFVLLSELPKATVQAAIGSIPLTLGLPCGKATLCAAVLSIFVTAPLGALAIDISCQKCLNHDKEDITYENSAKRR